ncbi:uncharacterized protein [Amphiura filiformis]|uniref:uncharacterized protein n=1 Tax=Amphiura filiformis TaxID=82378 RepID=UPI003B21D20C
MVAIPDNEDGLVDMDVLKEELQRWQPSGRQVIGCFSAASNVTGILVDTIAITSCLHQFGALAFWDYATAGPYVDIDMNPVITTCTDQSLASKDAIYLSPHKFVGGVETPGILIAKKRLFENPVPTGGGGGSVFFVTSEDHRYLQQVEMREEGGTPSIVGAIRAGMVFQMKQAVGTTNIMKREHELCRKAVEFWSSSPNLILLGNTSVPRLPIFSFLIRHPVTGQFLHHNFVCAVLNDVFGIQTRGGCACAGPYAQYLLGMDQTLAKRIETMLLEDHRLDRVHLRRYHEYSEREILRPGFTRLNLPYFMEEECVDFVLSAVAMVAEHGWKLLPQYMFNPETGEWKQRHHQVFQDRRWLGSISYASGKMQYADPPAPKPKGKFPQSYEECLSLAEGIFKKAEKTRLELADQSVLFSGETEALRWFILPSEAQSVLNNKGGSQTGVRKIMPFEPPQFNASSKCNLSSDGNISELDNVCENKDIGRTDPEEIEIQDIEWFDTKTFQSSVEHGFLGDTVQESHESPIHQSWIDNTNTSDRTPRTGGSQGDCSSAEDHGKCDPKCAIERQALEATDAGSEDVNVNKCDDQESVPYGPCLSSSQGEVTTTILTSQINPANLSSLQGEDTVNQDNDSFRSSLVDRSVPSDDVSDLVECSSSSSYSAVSSNAKLSSSEKAIDAEARDTNSKTAVSLSPVITQSNLAETNCNARNESKDSQDMAKEFKLSLKTKDVSPVCEVMPNSNAECLPCMLPRRQDKVKETRENESEAGDGSKTVVKFHAPPKKIFKPTLQAMEEYQMIQDGDRVLVCLSGGKDSLSLLHTLRQYQFVAKKKEIHFDLGAVTVDPQTSSYDPSPLKGYLRSLDLPYFYEEQCIIDMAASLQDGCDSICSFCSRMKRGRLYACARREGYNVLAMGQHLDDLTESFLMSVFHNGLLRTMKANYTVKEGDLRVIRPFVYVREKHLREFAEQSKLPVIPENCPACFEAPKERHRTKQLLAGQELLFPRLYSSLQTALKPLMARNKTGMESSLNKKRQLNGSVDDEEEDI